VLVLTIADRVCVSSPSVAPGWCLYRYSAVISCRTASPRYSSRSLSRGDWCGLSFANELCVTASS